MKLHLPLSLRSALLAVLSSFSLVYAEADPWIIDTQDEKLEGKTYTEDLNIIVTEDGKLTIDSSKTRLSCASTITVYGDLEMSSGYIAYADKMDSTALAEIAVSDGGNFNMSGGYIAYANEANSIARAEIAVSDGGSFNMSKGYIAYANKANSIARAEITVSDGGNFNMSGYSYIASAAEYGVASVKITVCGQGSEFDVQGFGSLSTSNSVIARANRVNSKASAELIVENKGVFNMEGMEIALCENGGATEATIIVRDSAEANMNHSDIAYCYGSGNAKATITVEKGGTCTVNGGHIAFVLGRNADVSVCARILVKGECFYINNTMAGISYEQISDDFGNSTVSADIIVTDGGRFDMDGGEISDNGSDSIATNANITVTGGGTFTMVDNPDNHSQNSGGKIAYAYGSSAANASIKVENKGKFVMNKGQIATYNRNDAKVFANIEVAKDGLFELNGTKAYIAYVLSSNAQEDSAVNAEITVKDNGMFDMKNGYIAYATRAINSEGGLNNVIGAKITVTDEGVFNMDDGGIAYAYGGTSGSKDDSKAGVEIMVDGNGTFNMKGGDIAYAYAVQSVETTHRANATITVKDDGVFNMSGGFFSRLGRTGKGASADAEIRITGRGLFNYTQGDNSQVGAFGDGAEFFIEEQGRLNMNGLSMASGSYKAPKITMRGGRLEKAAAYSGELYIDVTSDFEGDRIDLGGVNAARITSVKVAQPGVQITGLMAGSELTLSGSDNQLAVGVGNTNLAGGSGQAIIVFNDASGTVSFGSGSDFTLMLDIKAEILAALREEDTFTITLTNGTIDNWEAANFSFRSVLSELKGFSVQNVEGGILVIQGNADNIFIASRDGKPGDKGRETTLDEVKDKDAVIVDEDLTVNAGEEDVTMNHVDSMGEDADLTVKGNKDKDINAEFHNEKGVDTELGGDLTITNEGDGKANMDKTGEGRFTVGGNLNVDGDLNVKEGGLTLNGDDSHVGGDLSVGEKGGTEGNLEVNGKLTVDGHVDLEDGNGSITGDGELHIGEDGSLKMGDNVDLDGPSLTVDGELDMSGVDDPTLGGLGGGGDVKAGDDVDITIEGTGGDFSGNLEGSGRITVTGDGTNQSFTDVVAPDFDLAVKDGGHLSLTESTFGSVEAKKDGNLEFRAKGTGAKDNGGANVHLTGDLIFRNGSTTTFTFNMNADKLWNAQDALMVSVDGTIYIEREAQFILSSVQTGKEMPDGRKGDLTNILVMEGGSISVADEFPEDLSAGIAAQNSRTANSESLKVKLGGLFGLFYENPTLTVQGNEVLMSATYRKNAPGNNGNEDIGFLEETVKDNGGGSTEQAGAGLLDHADLEDDETLSAVGNALGNMLASGNNAGALKLMAAVAGSTVTSLGAAQRDATRGEMLRLRSHANARLPQKKGDEMPVHMWIEGNGDFRKLNADGYRSGYRLNSWGGTVGAAMAPSKDVLLGLALSAQYGDLEATAADTAKGDLDGYYLSMLAHVKDSEWGHTFIATLGKHEATLNRVVDYVEGSYATHGSTSGTAYGLAYELTYDIALEEDGSSVLQPLVSVSLVSTSMDGYNEQGAGGAGLSVGKQKWTTSSIAVGARWLAQLKDSIFGKTAYADLRVAVAQDMGDTQGGANVGLLANPGYRRQVRGAEIGRTSLQLGAGLNLPLDESTQLYLYSNIDLRRNSTSWNLGTGIRMAF